jgi:hypothetical protein
MPFYHRRDKFVWGSPPVISDATSLLTVTFNPIARPFRTQIRLLPALFLSVGSRLLVERQRLSFLEIGPDQLIDIRGKSQSEVLSTLLGQSLEFRIHGDSR